MLHLSTWVLSALVFSAFTGCMAPACASTFKFVTLSAPGTYVANPIAANSRDQVVGNVSAVLTEGYGFVWSDGNLAIVNGTSVLNDVSDGGIAVGAGNTAADFASYDLKTKILRNVPVPLCHKGRHSQCWGTGINNKGEIVGFTASQNKGVGFLWINSTVQKILPPGEKVSAAVGINSAGDILVVRGAPFLDHNGSFTAIAVPGAIETNPAFLTDSGDIGGSFDTNAATFGFVLSGGAYTTYSPAASTLTTVSGIGPTGQVYGSFDDASGISHGFENVNGRYYQIDVPNSTSTSISGVSTSGMIFGVYSDSQGSYGYVGKCPKDSVCTK